MASNKRTKQIKKVNKKNQDNQKPNYDINWVKISFLLGIAFGFFILYIITSNWIYNEKLYPTNYDWFLISTYQANVKSSCFYIGEPSVSIDYKTNTASIYTFFQKRKEYCNEKELASYGYPVFKISELKRWSVYNPEKLNYTYVVNLSEGMVYLTINLSKMIDNDPYSFGIIADIKSTFYSYYMLNIEGASKLDKLNFNYNSDFLNGYTCDENCFTIIDGDIKKDFQIFKGFSKSWEFNSPKVFIRFSPQSNWWLFWLKILDIFILAISAVAVYDAIIIELFMKWLDNKNKI
ncbi:hypothetical protein HYT53_04515 [Candidatus Woesearchaeota archaeon]|nr:hypothetical protein [Candidatus Woesearchaeota archaeon]